MEHPVKQETDDKNLAQGFSSVGRRRRVKEVFDGVVIPIFRPRFKAEVSEQRMKEDLSKIKDPKAKGLKEFNLDTVYSRMAEIGFEILPIEIPPSLLHATYYREDISRKYGGSPVNALPTIALERLKLHGINDWMFLNPSHNPHAPHFPGAPGIFFQSERKWEEWPEGKIMRVFVRLASGEWVLMGWYELTKSPSLTAAEWRSQPQSVKKTWHDSIYDKLKHRAVRARIALRKRLRREPSVKEIQEALDTKEAFKVDINHTDIARAYDSGDEHLAVWCMKCVGYPEDFQRENIEESPITDFVSWSGEKLKQTKRPKAKQSELKRADKRRRCSMDGEDVVGDDKGLSKRIRSRP